MTDSKILDRIKKLLALAHGNANSNEAANAAAQAQALMSRYAIDSMMLDVSETAEEPIETETLWVEGKRASTWRWRLAFEVCRVNQCKAYYWNNKKELRIIGKSSDAQIVRYFFTYLVRETERLCDEEIELRGSMGKTWCNNFKIGVVDTITNRLFEADEKTRQEMKKEASAGTALVLVNTAIARIDAARDAIELYGKQRLKLRQITTSSGRFDPDARASGRIAGKRIDLSRGGRSSLGAGAKGLLK